MKLSQKIKHIKRHKKNKKLKDRAEYIYWLVLENSNSCDETTYDGKVYVVSTLLYEVMRVNHIAIPDCIKCSGLAEDNFLIVPGEIIEFFDNPLDYLRDWCGIPRISSEPLYCHIDKPIAPEICTLNGVRV
jgi:hypothetical protein